MMFQLLHCTFWLFIELSSPALGAGHHLSFQSWLLFGELCPLNVIGALLAKLLLGAMVAHAR